MALPPLCTELGENVTVLSLLIQNWRLSPEADDPALDYAQHLPDLR
jgi:hypothetical protein